MNAINQLYGANARFDNTRPLTEDELRQRAPSIFALDAHESRSNRYRPIPTIEILRGLAKEGFLPVGAKQSTVRTPGREGHCKHLVRLRRVDDAAKYRVGDVVCEQLLRNANDGSSSYDLLSGLFRIRCMNSLVAMQEQIETIKVRHSGDVRAKVIEGTYKVLNASHLALTAPQEWAAMKLNRDEAVAFAEAAHMLRFGEPEDGEQPHAIQPVALLAPRREDDQAPDLWTNFNVIQENCIRGGLVGHAPDVNGVMRKRTMGAINSVDGDVKLNRALWTLAAKMAELKGGSKVAA